MRGGKLKLKEFIDKTTEQSGTPINRANMMAVQGYGAESVVFGENTIIKTNNDGEIETTTFAENQIVKTFSGEKTIVQTITFNENGYTKELS
jgi:hypothetical protein